MAENVKVIVRCRPMTQKEVDMKCQKIVEINSPRVVLNNPKDGQAPDKVFTFDSTYSDKVETHEIYNDLCYPLVENVLEGYNATIFAYGQTGCGKSHTMQGDSFNESPNECDIQKRGIISRAFDHIFEVINLSSDNKYLVFCSYLEIYNEQLRDLLSPSTQQLQLKESPDEGVTVQNLSHHNVHNLIECEKLLMTGLKSRKVGETLMNAQSSRSHTIFIITIEQSKKTIMEDMDNRNLLKSKLNLVDLAGSERQNKTGAMGDRLKEAMKINLSLSALGNVISALVDGKTKHVPYRDSKLTRLLQDSLGGNTKTLMVACISPTDYNYDETLSTLRYAHRAKNISNKPTINENPQDTLLQKYQQEIVRLQELLNSSQQLQIQDVNHDEIIEKIKMELKEKYENDKKQYQAEYETRINDIMVTKDVKQDSIGSIDDRNEILNRIEMIKKDLIGGECASDIKLKESRMRKKKAAQQRLSALANILSKIEEIDDRNLLQEHYTDQQQEIAIKMDIIKEQKKKIRLLDREINDLQAEFQLERTDYLETVRKLEKELKFVQQVYGKAMPFLRKHGKDWDLEVIQENSQWNDDLKKWRLPESILQQNIRLPPAGSPNFYSKDSRDINNEDDEVTKNKIIDTYFRPKRAVQLIQQSNEILNQWKGITKNGRFQNHLIESNNNFGRKLIDDGLMNDNNLNSSLVLNKDNVT